MAKFKVCIVSAGGVRHDLCGDLTEREAIDFCESLNWEYCDENRFVWGLDYMEDDDNWDRWECEPSRDDWDTDEDY